ncbi:MAG: aldolase [Thermoplasmata archaeon]|nr:aldolase [Thermoplasmata archaeon]
MEVKVPLDVPEKAKETYVSNFKLVTHDKGYLMLFAGDQKVEHLNNDFYGEGIHPDDADPEHLFRIASQGKIGVFATQLGLVARYGADYPNIPYLIKLNSKTNLVKTAQKDPFNCELCTVSQVVQFRDMSHLKIAAVGYTIYLGSEFEKEMMWQAQQAILEAHKDGLLVVLWIYPRGKAVPDEKDPHLIAGATGIALCLGSDFVKINAPKRDGKSDPAMLKEITTAAGRTNVVCAGGSSRPPKEFLQELYEQIHIGGTKGNATGRNIHQKSLKEAVRMCNAISAITVEDADVEKAWKIYNGE